MGQPRKITVPIIGFNNADGSCGGAETFTFDGVSYPDRVVTSYYDILVEEIETTSVANRKILTHGVTTTEDFGFHKDVGMYFFHETDRVNIHQIFSIALLSKDFLLKLQQCSDKYLQIYHGPAMALDHHQKGSVVGINNDKQVGTVILDEIDYLCEVNEAWKTTNSDTWVIFTQNRQKYVEREISLCLIIYKYFISVLGCL